MAVSMAHKLLHLGPEECDEIGIPGLRPGEATLLCKQMERELNSPPTSSAGRLFDGVAALLGIRGVAEYEAQAAIELEMHAHASSRRPRSLLPVQIDGSGPVELQLRPLLSGILEARKAGESVPDIAWRFHRTMAEASYQLALRGVDLCGSDRVVASGGVFQNRLLLALTVARFERSALQLFTHNRVPCNDGSIALGQAVIARETLTGGNA